MVCLAWQSSGQDVHSKGSRLVRDLRYQAPLETVPAQKVTECQLRMDKSRNCLQPDVQNI
ncbi:hypothetical protein DPMN_009412 [Dreissena polymorpha]|uniref:Uncharacterized protein n=1 Tax=Dreissena polymorpha TaxID=45954 RepID=A0A9D4RY67_DREPO|nr:hypothetical protein DPMN_009412 [Dreissena polymorpha]